MNRRSFLRTATLLAGAYSLHACKDAAGPEKDPGEPRVDEPLKVCLYSDAHAGYEGTETIPPAETIHRQILEHFKSYKPNIIFNLGDHIHNLGEEQWNEFGSLTADIRASSRYYPVFGNHDGGDGGEVGFLEFFKGDLPNNEGENLYYWIRHDHVLFVVLDVHDRSESSHLIQKSWLENVLTEQDDATFKFILFHVPSWTTGGRGPFPYARFFNSTCMDHGVDIVFNGHIHAYERFLLDGMNFVVSGGGGGFGCSEETRFAHCLNMNEDTIALAPFRQAAAEKYNFLQLEIFSNKGTLTAIDLEGNEIDMFSIKKQL